MMALDGGRIGIASQALGIAQAAREEGLAYARERKQFGAPIADFQAIQWMLADNETELETARLLTLRAAFLKEQRPGLRARGGHGQAGGERARVPHLRPQRADPRRGAATCGIFRPSATCAMCA